MTEHPPNVGPDDELWQQFYTNELRLQEQAEHAYKEIEGYNAIFLNQLAGLEESVFHVVGEFGSDDDSRADLRPQEIRGQSYMTLLYLRPDTRETLQEQGEDPDTIENLGNPHIIRGEVPARTKQLLENLIKSLGATIVQEKSTPEKTVWRGDVAGEPVELDVYNTQQRKYGVDLDMKVDTLWVYACKPFGDEDDADSANNPNSSKINPEDVDDEGVALKSTYVAKDSKNKNKPKQRKRFFLKRRKFS